MNKIQKTKTPPLPPLKLKEGDTFAKRCGVSKARRSAIGRLIIDLGKKTKFEPATISFSDLILYLYPHLKTIQEVLYITHVLAAEDQIWDLMSLSIYCNDIFDLL